MSYWSKSSDPSKGKKQSGPAPVLQEKSGGLPTASTVRKMIKGMMPSATENEFYEMEMGEVINVILKEPELPDLKVLDNVVEEATPEPVEESPTEETLPDSTKTDDNNDEGEE